MSDLQRRDPRSPGTVRGLPQHLAPDLGLHAGNEPTPDSPRHSPPEHRRPLSLPGCEGMGRILEGKKLRAGPIPPRQACLRT